MQIDDVRQLADDLDKAPTSEDVIERIIHEVVLLQRGHNQLVIAYEQATARIDQQDEKITLLIKLMDSNRVEIEDLKLKLETGGIVQ